MKKSQLTEAETITSIREKFLKKDSYYNKYNFFDNFVDYDSSRSSCSGSCDDYCRCTVITGTQINSVDLHGMIEGLTKKSEFPIINYCIDRIFRNHEVYDRSKFNVGVSGGYYGEETSGVSPNDPKLFDEIIKDIQSLDGLSDANKIKKALEGEYGYVLDKIKDAATVNIIDVKPEDIIFPQGFYQKKVKAKEEDYYKNYSMPRAIVSDNLAIIDGYHRTTSAVLNELKEIQVIVIK